MKVETKLSPRERKRRRAEREHERKRERKQLKSRDLPKEKRRNFFASHSPKEKSSRNRLPDRVTVPTRTRTPPPRCSGRSSAACASPGSSFSCRHLSSPKFLPSQLLSICSQAHGYTPSTAKEQALILILYRDTLPAKQQHNQQQI